MYLRTVTRTNKDGSKVEYYQLAHNERHPVTRKPVAKIIHNFGRADEFDPDQLKRLCASIARVCGLKVVDPTDPTKEPDAQENTQPAENLKIIGTRAFGTVLAIEALWEKLDIGKKLRKLCKKKKLKAPYERALLAMTANRLCNPESKLGVWDRWLDTVYLPTCNSVKLDHMYEAMDFLHDHIAEVEDAVFFSTANLFNLDVDLIFYDTTTASFSIDHEDEIRKYGKSKEGGWNAQVVVALAVTKDGLPVRSWVFPGNTTDVNTIETVRKDLRDWNLNRTLFVADAGMNSIKNRKELSRACGKYILATRMASVAEIKKKVLSNRSRYTVLKDNLRAKEVIVGNGERRRRYILCHNPKEEKRQKAHRQEVITILEKELSKHKDQKATARWAIDLLASKRYKPYLTVTETGRIRIDRKKIKEVERYDGKWVIETNDDTISLEDAANGYKSLLVIERCFRSLKRTQIKMMPMYHWATRRIETHVKICVLALLIERIAEQICGVPWNHIRNELAKLQATEFLSDTYRIIRRNEIDVRTQSILKKLGIPMPKDVLSLNPRT